MINFGYLLLATGAACLIWGLAIELQDWRGDRHDR